MRILKATFLIIGLTLFLLVVPTAQASSPEEGSGNFTTEREFTGFKVTDDGNIKINLTTTATFTGDVDGVVVVDAVVTLHPDGTFNLVAQEGSFTGSVNGRSGTANLQAGELNGEGPDEDLCCYLGFFQLKGTTGALENFSAKINLANQPEGKTYSSSAHFH